MLQPLYEQIRKIHPVSEEAAHALGKCFEIIEAPKKHLLLRDGETCEHHYFVLKGLARMYYIKDGEEVCSVFIEENYFFNAAQSFYPRKPGYEYIETIERSTVARIHYDDLQGLYQAYPELNIIAWVITEYYLVKSQERLFLLRRQTAEERYIYFIEHYVTLQQRVPLKYIASYLGLTLETLSRIRNKIRK